MLAPYTINPAAACADEGGAGPSAPAPRLRRQKRRGATAMEYCVMASFVIVVLVMAVQHIGALVAPSFTKASKGWNNTSSTGS
jgi:Flp pilus assembly pilin Flp